MSNYKWHIQSTTKIEDIDKLVDILLKNRGIKDKEPFLNPPNPYDFAQNDPEFKKIIKEEILPALEIIFKAISNEQTIIIHGDYDADGQTATAILWRTIYNDLSYTNIIPYIPRRLDEGYGLSDDSLSGIIQKLQEKGVNNIKEASPLIITVDCGIVSIEESKKTKDLGFKLIITDHHQKDKKLPLADAIIHTTNATGAGISWLLSRFLREKHQNNQNEIKDPLPNKYLDLAAIGTICDLQPLVGFNRTIAKYGLAELNKDPNPGIKALIQAADIKDLTIDTYNIGWQLGPRLNATGRLEDAMESLRLLCTDSPQQALETAQKLNELNQTRQYKTQKDLEFALSEIQLLIDQNGIPNVIITSSTEYHEGIVGLVAGKITQAHHRSSIAISIDEKNGLAKGSARSIKGISIIEELRKVDQSIFLGLGGHDMAAGFSIKSSELNKFTCELNEISQSWDKSHFTKEITIDAELHSQLINSDTYEKISTLKPFGIGNPKPIFLTKGLEIFNITRFGKENKHVRLFLTKENQNFTAIGFSIDSQKAATISIGKIIDLVYEVTLNTWNGNTSLELKIVDFRIADS